MCFVLLGSRANWTGAFEKINNYVWCPFDKFKYSWTFAYCHTLYSWKLITRRQRVLFAVDLPIHIFILSIGIIFAVGIRAAWALNKVEKWKRQVTRHCFKGNTRRLTTAYWPKQLVKSSLKSKWTLTTWLRVYSQEFSTGHPSNSYSARRSRFTPPFMIAIWRRFCSFKIWL